VEGRECDEGVAEAAEAVDQDPFGGDCHCLCLVCLVPGLTANETKEGGGAC
jgi:hypothetical protein